MEKRTDKNSYTIIFAIVMVVIVGGLLALSAYGLKGTIGGNKEIEKKQNILYAMGINENDESNAKFISKNKVEAEFTKYIKKQLVIQGDDVKVDDKAYLIDLKKELSAAKNVGYKRRYPLFLGKKDGKIYYIVPIRGKGLWDAIWGFVSMDKNMVVQGVYFDHKGETAGLGANIKQRFFMDDFIGEHLLDKNGKFKGISVTKGNNDPKNNDKLDNEVDAISGATLTGNGLTAMVYSGIAPYASYFIMNKK